MMDREMTNQVEAGADRKCSTQDCILNEGHDGLHMYACAGPHCPGLPWKASERAHPHSCAYQEGDEEYPPPDRAPYEKPRIVELSADGLTFVDQKWESCMRAVGAARKRVSEASDALKALRRAARKATTAVAELEVALQQAERAAARRREDG